MCLTPLTLKDNTQVSFPVDCGKCPQCVKKRASGWSFRLRKQAEVSTSALFITLTYDTEHVPITNKGYMTLNPNHVTLWLKRLRKQHQEKIKYFYVGEYGSQTERPHYHMIIYNADMNIIDKTWEYGKVHYGQVTGASIGYTLKYMIKDGKIPKHKNDDRLPEFARMSKGLGENYITKSIVEYHIHKRSILDRLHLVIDGKKISMPRYYKNMIYVPQEKLIIQQHAKIYEQKKIEIERQTDPHSKVEADKAKFQKMYNSKYLGKTKN